jgi:hypothetical protein
VGSAALLLGIAAAMPGCGGGGGGGSTNFNGDIDDPAIVLTGTPGRISQTPQEANAGAGTTPPPTFSVSVTTENHWFRLEFPFDVDPTSILTTDPLTQPFSYLTGNITITDENGAHVPGLALVNGVDAFGVDRSAQIPHDLAPNGADRNLGKRVFLFVADVDGNLATKAAFGGYTAGPNNSRIEQATSTISLVRVTAGLVNGIDLDAAWSFAIGATDTQPPYIVSISSEKRDPTDPLNPASIAADGTLLVKFSEPMVPSTVGHSAALDGFPYDANLPNPLTSPPFPSTTLTATVNTAVGTLFVPFDCTPANVNNLTKFRLRPLISLPPNTSVDVLVRAFTTNTQVSSIDLSGNFFDGPDADNDSVPDGTDVTSTFSVGPGPAIVNIPVSPEVIYWAPVVGDGIGAIDLNGWGLGTNTPGANAGIRDRATLITKPWLDFNGCEVSPGGLNLVDGIGLWAHPGNLPTPTDPCTMLPMIQWRHNRYWYPVGTGSYPYGPGPNAARGEIWEAPTDPGNPGTPFPGVNEGSSGFETLCRDSNGDVILTGREFAQVGNVQDMIVGEFLDRVFYDHKSTRNRNSLHLSFFGGGNTQGRNVISDPPTPNPPPTRYWVGLPQIDVVLDQSNPTEPMLIEGDEVFTGLRVGPLAQAQFVNAARTNSFIHLRTNTINPNAVDQLVFPGIVGGTLGNGPGGQSATAIYTFAARQQVGNFLYATDATSRELHAINSNTMRVITSISLPDPTGLAIAPDMEYLYVTNTADDSMSVVGCDPTSPNFHRELARVPTGPGPRAIALQPEAEDIFVCNFLGNSVSIIDVNSLTTRKTLDSLISGPFDVEVSERQEIPSAPHPFGWACGLYFAYVSNSVGNTVVVYESGPDGPQGIGINNIRGALPLDDTNDPMIAPRGLCFSPFVNNQFLLAGGIFVTHQDEQGFGRVSHIQFTQQALFGPLPIAPPPGFFIPPGFTDRVFEITRTWGDTVNARLIGTRPLDVVLADMNTAGYQSTPSGAPNGGGVGDAPKTEVTGGVNSKNHNRLGANTQGIAWQPDRLYVGFEDRSEIQVLDPSNAGTIVNTIAPHGNGGTKKLMSFWRQ